MSDADFAALYGPGRRAPSCARDERPALMPHAWQAETDRDRYRAALREIATTDLKRCSAGYLQGIARKALGIEAEQRED